MGAGLMSTFPSFLRSIRSLDAVLKKLPDGPNWTVEGKSSFFCPS